MKFTNSFVASIFALAASSVSAVIIDARDPPYNTINPVVGININSEEPLRAAAMLAMVGMYKSLYGQDSIRVPSQVQIVYQDGSREKANVICTLGTGCVRPAPNTQQAGGGGGGPVERPPSRPPISDGSDKPWKHVCGVVNAGGSTSLTCILVP